MFAEHAGLAQTMLRGSWSASSHRPRARQQAYVSCTIREVLASIPDARARLEPLRPHPSRGLPRRTRNNAKRAVGWNTGSPEIVKAKAEAIHNLTHRRRGRCGSDCTRPVPGSPCPVFQGDS